MLFQKLFLFSFFLATLFAGIWIGPKSLAFQSDSLGQTQRISTNHLFSLAEVEEDYDSLIQLINLYHTKLFVNRDDFNQFCSIRRSLLHDRMNELEFYRVVSPLVSHLNCGHSMISLSNRYISNVFIQRKVFPLTIRFIENHLYVYKDYFSTRIPPGSEILNINGKDSGEIIDLLLNNISSDGSNLTYKVYKINYLFAQFYYYYVDDSETFFITYKNPQNGTILQKNGTILQKNISGVLLPKVFIKNPLPYQLPLQSQMIGKKYGILKVPSFEYYKSEDIAHFKTYTDRFFAQMKKKKITHLILDLRYNKGGNPICSTYLFSYLILKPTLYFDPDFSFQDEKMNLDLTKIEPAENYFEGNLYVLMNGGCFSATGQLCSLLKSQKIGTLIGEETGGSFACSALTGDCGIFILKNTQLILELSTRVYKTHVSGLAF